VQLAERVAREFSIITPGTELKWQTLQPAPGPYRFDYADKFVAWAHGQGLAVRGHNLVWPNYGTPEWVSASVTRENARSVLENHIQTVVRRYAGKIHSWDVLNEPLNVWDKRPDLLAAKPWAQLLGPEYIDLCFANAASADPKARLIWNQNYVESDDAGDEQNRQAVLSQLRRLKSNGVPIHGVGIESHLFIERPIATTQMRGFFDQVRSMGLEVQVTELDVIETSAPAEVAARDRQVADKYREYLEFVLKYAEPTVVSFWTFSDRHNWLDWAAKSSPKYRRTDGLPHRPGLIDENLRAKPAYNAVAAALTGAGHDTKQLSPLR
jgi:endo-1,4-beta-xylanase